MPEEITCLIADDHEVVREGLRLSLSRAPHIRVIGEASDGASAVALAERRRPDVVIMDVRMPGMDGLEATKLLRERVPDTAVLLGMARSHDQAKLDAQLAAMRQACEDAAAARGATVEFEAEEIYRTYKIDEDARPYREAAVAIASLGLEVVPRKSGGGTDGNFFNAKGIPCVALSTGMVDEHATTEHIAIDDLVLAAKTLVAIATLPPQEEEPTS